MRRYTAEEDERIRVCTDAKALAEELGVSVASIYVRRNKLAGPVSKTNISDEEVAKVKAAILEQLSHYTRMSDTFEAVAKELGLSAWSVRYIYEKKLNRRLI